MKPLVNIDQLDNFIEREDGPFKERCAVIGKNIGAKKLNYSIAIVPPGKKMCPFHNHRINEELFIIIEGTGILRFGSQTYELKRHDVIACPPGDRSVAHQIINTGTADLKYFCLSTAEPFDICEYPDSNKILSIDRQENRDFRHISRTDQAVDYMHGEDS